MIKRLTSRIIYNSRGQKTIEAEIETDKGISRGSAPAGASAGIHEVPGFPQSPEEAVRIIGSEIAPAIRGLSELETEVIDRKLKDIDGTSDFSRLGGSGAIAISFAVLKSAAVSSGRPVWEFLNPSAKKFPYPLGDVVGGGAHGGGFDIQEFLMIPRGAKNIFEAVGTNALIHNKIKENLAKEDPHFLYGKNDEGAWTTSLPIEKVFDVMIRSKDEYDSDAMIGMDIAASELWDKKKQRYIYKKQGLELSTGEQIDYILGLVSTYPILFVEDPLHEDDFDGFSELNSKNKAMTCGDDLTTTNPDRLTEAIKKGSIDSIIVKPNQIGTISDTLKVFEICKKNGIKPVLSHRSGETTEEIIAHLAHSAEAPLIKTGVVCGERIAKLNELIRIWRDGSEMVRI